MLAVVLVGDIANNWIELINEFLNAHSPFQVDMPTAEPNVGRVQLQDLRKASCIHKLAFVHKQRRGRRKTAEDNWQKARLEYLV
jgi:hypothetical protein